MFVCQIGKASCRQSANAENKTEQTGSAAVGMAVGAIHEGVSFIQFILA
jgi:hypothetical protein